MYLQVHSIIDKMTGCDVQWVKTQSGMVSVGKLEKGELELAVLGSPPTTIALSPPRSLPLQVISIQEEFWESDGMLVRPEIKNVEDLRGKTIGAPFGSTSHYQLLVFLRIAGVCIDMCVGMCAHMSVCMDMCEDMLDSWMWLPGLIKAVSVVNFVGLQRP